MIGFNHIRARARLTQGLEPFPARGAWKRFFDYLMYGVGLIAPFALVPQILQLYTSKSSVGLSLPTWTLFVVVNILWALYGAVHKDKQLFLANALVLLANLTVVIGILLY